MSDWDKYPLATSALPPQAASPWDNFPLARPNEQLDTSVNTDNVVQQMLRGVPIGGAYADKFLAAGNAALQPVTGTQGKSQAPDFKSRYEENLTRNVAQGNAFETQRPNSALALQLSGAIPATLAATRAAPFLMGASGPMLAQVLMGGVSGAGIGGLDQYLRGNDATTGAMYGGVGGVVSPVIAKGLGAAWQGAKNYFTGNAASRELAETVGQNIPSAAINRVAKNAADDALTPSMVAQRAADLGPEGMVMDVAPQLRSRAEAVATMPGKGQNTVLQAVENRVGPMGETSAARLSQALDAELGPSPNVVDMTDRVADIVKQHADPLYKQTMSKFTGLSDDTLNELSKRPAISEAMNQAEAMAANYGETVNRSAPDLRYWDYAKKALDRRINGFMRNGDDLSSQQKADLGGLLASKNALVEHLDAITKGEYKAARSVAALKPELNEALQTGRDAFNSKLLPEEFAALVADKSIPEQAMLKAGMRREIERIMAGAGNEAQAARRILNSNANMDKIEQVLGKDAADAIRTQLSRESTFQETKNVISGNSATMRRAESVADLKGPNAPNRQDLTILGAGITGAQKLFRAATSEGFDKTRQGVANLLTAKGDKIEPVVEILLDVANKRAKSASQADQIKDLVNILMRGSQVPAMNRR